MKNRFIIKKEQKLLGFLLENIEKNKKEIKNLLKFGSISIDNKVITKFDYILKINQVLEINYYKKSELINILYEDKDIIVVDKEAGLLTISDGKSDLTLYKLVSDYVKTKNKQNKIFVIHRLDKDTSGVVMFAKNENIKKLYQDNWNELVLKREYIAIVSGKTKKDGVIKSYLVENKNHIVHSTKEGKLAITNYQKLKEDNNYTWLLIDIKTGRKNQIRVHMKENNTPIIGDIKYGIVSKKYNRLCLHAYRLLIINPINKKEMSFVAPVPKMFNLHLKQD